MASKEPMEEGADHAHLLRVEGGELVALEDSQGKRGTRVDVNDLFFNLPVRRHFLKSAAAETAACRRTLVEKALAFPEVSFRFFSDGRLKFFFPPTDLKQRICAAFALKAEHLELLSGRGDGYRLTVVAARPELVRRDRRLLQVYVNRRRLDAYRLLQALEYAYSAYMPGGQFPICFAFLEVDPGLVDFNIHPAKKEARFRNPENLRRGMLDLVRAYLEALRGGGRNAAAVAAPLGSGMFPQAGGDTQAGTLPPAAPYGGYPPAGEAAPGAPPRAAPADAAQPAGAGPVVRGQLFKLFLLVEQGQRLFIIDQHAAHERLLYERLKNKRSPIQELLFPMRFDVSPDEASLLEKRLQFLLSLGIVLKRREAAVYEVTSLPEDLLCLEEDAVREALLGRQGSLEELEHRLYSLAACRLAVKEGEELDAHTAAELAGAVLNLNQDRCPHGRPLWVEVSREELLRRVGRI
jgi:DNA mismatch repair protein MutL